MFTTFPEDAQYLSRKDPHQLLGTCSRHAIDLDGSSWPSVEHYLHGMKFEQPALRVQISEASKPAVAARIALMNVFRRRRDWKTIRRTVMTRGMYIKCRTWPEVAQALLDTGDRMLVENDAYDSYWGCGRDLRGHNYFGEVLMNVREKLREEQKHR